ncbi:MAG: FtsX-like permease family protein [Mucilaginibacter sp.]|nr:FtsX-like permease family protein [Mucilaginibacter sp.]
MIKINLKLAIRNIFRNKLYSAINIIGLSVASAFCILVYLYVKNEQSFDSFHQDLSRLYRVEQSDIFGSTSSRIKLKKNFFSFLSHDAGQLNMIQTPTILAVDLKRNFPEIENAIRFEGLGAETIRVGNKSFKEQDNNLTYADADFFKVFNYPLIEGNANTVLQGRNQAVISEKLALKYFGKINAVGKVFTMPNELNRPPVTVSGVFKDFPANSSFQFDMIIPIESNPDYKDNLARGTNSFSDPLVIKLKKRTNVNRFQQKLSTFAAGYFQDLINSMKKHDPKKKYAGMNLYLRPFNQAHYNQSPGWNHFTDLNSIYQLVCITAIILFIACLNYILLTLTNTVSRSQDVGIRKTIGAERYRIIFQYYTETQLLACTSVLIGYLIAVICLPLLNGITNTDINLSGFSNGAVFLFLLLFSVVLGLLAGIYPALAMSGLKPLNIMRSFSAYKLSPFLSKFLVVLQFSICTILVISTLVINKQLHYINQTDMGFNKDQVLIIRSPYGWADKQNPKVLKERLINYAATEPGVQDITSVSIVYGGYNNNAFFINGEKVMLQALDIDYNYFSFLKIPIIKGRSFSKDVATDTAKLNLPGLRTAQTFSLASRAIVVNETLYNMLGRPKLDEVNRQMGGPIIGVCRDYHSEDLTKKIQPAYHTVEKYGPFSFWLKIRAGQSLPAEIEKIRARWNILTNSAPLDYTFLDQEVAKNYVEYQRWMKTITVSCIIAILIACLGLFGLSGLATINRTKEIGIRKVLGASISNLFIMLNRGTLILAAGAFFIAVPLGYYLVHQWLDNFAYRIKPDWILFVTAGAIAMLTAIIAVSYHTIKAAVANPVNSLRSE